MVARRYFSSTREGGKDRIVGRRVDVSVRKLQERERGDERGWRRKESGTEEDGQERETKMRKTKVGGRTEEEEIIKGIEGARGRTRDRRSGRGGKEGEGATARNALPPPTGVENEAICSVPR